VFGEEQANPRTGTTPSGAIDRKSALNRARGDRGENSVRAGRARSSWSCRPRSLLAEEPLRLSLRGALFPLAAEAHHHERPPTRDPGPRAGRTFARDRTGNRLLHG